MILTLALDAAAAPCAVDPDEVERAAAAIDGAIDGDDMVSAGATWRRLQEQLPCLDGPMPAAVWADLLVDLALLEHTAGLRSWTQPLQVATEVRPDVDRDIGPSEFRAFVPTHPPDPVGPLPADARYWLDGRLIDEEPVLVGGPHVVQQERNGVWTSVVLRDAPFPDYWKVPEEIPDTPAQAGTEDASFAILWALGGGRGDGQRLDGAAPGVPTDSAVRALAGLGVHGRFQPTVVGIAANLTGAAPFGARLGAGGDLSVAVGGRVSAVAGVGFETAAIEQADADRLVFVGRPQIGVVAAVPAGDWDLRAGAGGGWTLAALAGTAWLGASPVTGGPVRPVVGLDAGFSTVRFDEEGGTRRLDTSRWYAGLGAGAAF